MGGKSFMDCPIEVRSKIFRNCPPNALCALMLGNKVLLNEASIALYTRIKITEKNIRRVIKSYLASQDAQPGGPCGKEWKKKRLGLVKKISLEYEAAVISLSHGQSAVAVRKPDLLSLIQNLPKTTATIFPNVQSLIINFDGVLYDHRLDTLDRLDSMIGARNVCDATDCSETSIVAHHPHGSSDYWLEVSNGQRASRNPVPPEIVTYHGCKDRSILRRHAAPIVRICYHYQLPEDTEEIVCEGSSFLQTTIDDQLDHWYRDTKSIRPSFEFYQSCAEEVFPKGKGRVTFNKMPKEDDEALAKKITDGVIERSPELEGRLKVFTFEETWRARCVACRRPMNVMRYEVGK